MHASAERPSGPDLVMMYLLPTRVSSAGWDMAFARQKPRRRRWVGAGPAGGARGQGTLLSASFRTARGPFPLKGSG